MNDDEVLNEVFVLLYKAWVEGVDEPTRFVGLQGDAIVIFTPGDKTVALTLVPVSPGVVWGA